MRLRPPSLTVAVLSSTLLAGSLVALPASAVAAGPTSLNVDDRYRPTAALGFHDLDRNNTERRLRDDLTGRLLGQVEFAQSSTVNPTGNSAAELPTLVAERTALLLFTPMSADGTDLDPLDGSYSVEVSVKGVRQGTISMTHPNRIPSSDQTYRRGDVVYSQRAWTAEMPWQWVRPGMTLAFTATSSSVEGVTGTQGHLMKIDVAAPTEIVINNIQLGMLTTAPDGSGQRFIKNPADGATDYFQTLPVSKMVMAQYDKVELKKVIVASGAIYTERSVQNGDVYSGDMRENVGKAQVSTGINLATWGITSSPMNQSQPGVTNQRVIHHSAGMYANGRQSHGLSGGNGMATLYDSVGNELSHELGHSYGLGHYPGTDGSKVGDDRIRNATHHMDSGWGWIPYRGVMRSNLDSNNYTDTRDITGYTFGETLAKKYNFLTDTMSGGWDSSDYSDYTHVTGYSQKRIQNYLSTTVADTAYPSGYRSWDADAGDWVDSKVKNPGFNRLAPKKVGVDVFTLLGGYNPAKPEQTVLYPAFRSNYGTTFDLPQAAVEGTSSTRQCWLQVDFATAPTQYVALDASDGVKQLNVNVAQDEKPTGAQVACRADGVTTAMGEPITIATDLAPLPAAVVVGQEAGFDTLRAQEFAALEPALLAQADVAVPVLTTMQQRQVRGWSDDLSGLSPTARAVAERFLAAEEQAADLATFTVQHADDLAAGDSAARTELTTWLRSNGHVDSTAAVLPTGRRVTTDGGKCMYLDASAPTEALVRVRTSASGCTNGAEELWWTDVAGRIHPASRPELCVRAETPVVLRECSTTDAEQRWIFQADGHVVRSTATSSALDLYRTNHRPGLYAHSNGSNQFWTGLTPSPNALLGSLTGSAISALWETRKPTVTLRADGVDATTGWARTATSVQAVGSDEFSTTATGLTTRVALGDGEFVPGPITLDEGVSTVRGRVTDSRGVSTSTTGTFRVDTVAPTSTATVGRDGLTLTGADATSGVDRLEHRVDGGEWTVWTKPVALPDVDGLIQHARVEHRAVDVAGNASAPQRLAAPSTSATLRADALSLAHAQSGAVTVDVTATGISDVTGTVRVTLPDNVRIEAAVVDGRATVALPTLPAGRHVLALSHVGDARLGTGTGAVTVDVAEKPVVSEPEPVAALVPAQLTATAPAQTHGKRGTVSVTVKAAGVTGVAGTVATTLPNGTLVTAAVRKGKASLALPSLPAGRHVLLLTHDGDPRLRATSVKATVKVAKSPATIVTKVGGRKKSLTLKSPVTGSARKKLAVKARVRPASGEKYTGKVTMTVSRVVDGRSKGLVTAKVKTVDGVARWTVPAAKIRKPGTYTVRTTWMGTSDIASTKSNVVTLTVR